MRKLLLGLVCLVIAVTTTMTLSACKKSAPSAGYVATYSATKTVEAVPAAAAEYSKNIGDIVTVPANASTIAELIKMGLAFKNENAFANYTDKNGYDLSAGQTIAASRLKDVTINLGNIEKLVELGWVTDITSANSYYKDRTYRASGIGNFTLADNKKVNDIADLGACVIKEQFYVGNVSSMKLYFIDYNDYLIRADIDGTNMNSLGNFEWHTANYRGESTETPYSFSLSSGYYRLASLDGLGLSSEAVMGDDGAYIYLSSNSGTVTVPLIRGVGECTVNDLTNIDIVASSVYCYKNIVTLTAKNLADFAALGLINSTASSNVYYQMYNQYGNEFTLTEGYKIDIAVSANNVENLIAMGLVTKTKDAVAAKAAATKTINFAFNKDNTATLTIAETGKDTVTKQFVYTYVDKDSTVLPAYYFGNDDGYDTAELVATKLYVTIGGENYTLSKI